MKTDAGYHLLLVAACVVCLASVQAAPETLQLVHVLYRHGARTPINDYPNDPNAGAWPQGSGQLTNQGKRNQLELGRFLRNRYDGYLPAKYHLNYILVRSTDVDRTLMSAEVNLAGLYPPQGDDVWDPTFNWQPIPVHTVPVEDDLLLKSYDSCDAFVAERTRVFNSKNMTTLNEHYKALYEHLAEHSGKPVANVQDVSYLYDTLSINARANLITPDWALETLPEYPAPVFPNTMEPLNNLEFGLYGATELQRRLGGGPLLKQMLQQMSARADNTLVPPERRLFVYSAHDTDVACLLTTLQVYNGIAPPLASCLMVELHADDTDNYVVQVWYRNDTSADPYLLQVPGCDASCPLHQLVDLTKNVVPGDMDEECKV